MMTYFIYHILCNIRVGVNKIVLCSFCFRVQNNEYILSQDFLYNQNYMKFFI